MVQSTGREHGFPADTWVHARYVLYLRYTNGAETKGTNRIACVPGGLQLLQGEVRDVLSVSSSRHFSSCNSRIQYHLHDGRLNIGWPGREAKLANVVLSVARVGLLINRKLAPSFVRASQACTV